MKIGIEKDPVPVAGLALNFSPMPRMAPPPLGSVRLGPAAGAGPAVAPAPSNGPFGLGWHLAVPSISRRTEKGLPLYRDAIDSDTFVLSGAEDLVRSEVPDGAPWTKGQRVDGGGYRVECFRPRVEALYARIERWTNTSTGDVHWRSITKDNVTSIYGQSTGARITDPDNAQRIFRWLLERSRDAYGNEIAYLYRPENETNVPSVIYEQGRHHANTYLDRIRYGNRSTTPDPATLSDWLFEVVFDYGERAAPPNYPTYAPAQGWPYRSDPFSSYRAGFEIRTRRLCQRVLMYHHIPDLKNDGLGNALPYLVRSTEFGYTPGAAFTYLSSIQQIGYVDTNDRLEHPAVEFDYTQGVPDPVVHTLDAESARNLPMGVDGRTYQWADLDGEGLQGVLTEQASALYHKRNLGGGKFGPMQVVGTRPSASLAAGGQLMDLAGDGQKYLVQFARPMAGYQKRTQDESWAPFRPFKALPTITFEDPNLRFIDLDGDGTADVLITQPGLLTWYRSKGTEGFEFVGQIATGRDEEKAPAIVFADGTQTVFLADMTGDGLQDIVRVRYSSVCYWPNLGYGRFGAKVQIANSPRLDNRERFDPKRVRLADIDGSGTADLIYFRSDGVHYWLNQAGNSLSSEQHLQGFPAVDNFTALSAVDLLGNGTTCLVWSSPLPHAARAPLRYVDLNSGVKPHLLRSIDNNLGQHTTIEYTPSTRFYVQDRQQGQPWVTRLPFPVQVVTRVVTEDVVSGATLTTRYAYHHGYYDSPEREFRGFGMVEQWDAEVLPPGGAPDPDLYVPPIHTKTWFHTGAFFAAGLISRQHAREYYPGDAAAVDLPDSLLDGNFSVREQREALRALRGKMLRQEIYADDGNPAPYQVEEHNYLVRKFQDATDKRYGVFCAHPLETLSDHYECNPDDPRITHEVTLAVDDYGQVTKSVSLAYSRRTAQRPLDVPDAQTKTLATYTEKRFADNPAETDWYRVSAPVETSIWDVPGLVAANDKPIARSALAAIINYNEKKYDEAAAAGDRRLVSRERIYYYDDVLAAPLALGTAERLALVQSTYRMAFPDTYPGAVYGGDVTNQMLSDVGFHSEDNAWWYPSGIQTFDAAKFYQAVAFEDPWGNITNQTWDAHSLLAVTVEAPYINTITVANDYRVLAPWQLTDPNDDVTRSTFDALARVVKLTVCGKVTIVGGNEVVEGDTLAAPTEVFEYHMDVTPAHVFHAAREIHADGTDPSNAAAPWQRSYTYFDGFGREVMKKIQAEPDENNNARWVGTGRTVFNNKGLPTKQYEPFFSATSAWETEATVVQHGVTPILQYDPLGRLVRTIFPDGSLSRVGIGAWERWTWDQNDTLLDARCTWRTRPNQTVAEQRATTEALKHRGTPKRERLDPLGRVVEAQEDNTIHNEAATVLQDGTVATDPPDASKLYRTLFVLDIQGNQLQVIDHRAANAGVPYVTQEQKFDMAGQPLYRKSCDAGESWSRPDVAQKPSWAKDARGFKTLRSYDALRRPTQLDVTRPDTTTFVAESLVYGDNPAVGGAANARSKNLFGKLYQQKDTAGVVTNETYDFKGNVLRTTRQAIRAYNGAPDWGDPYLDPFVSETEYDALNRPTRLVLPARFAGGNTTNEVKPHYNEAGLLERIEVRPQYAGADFSDYVSNIDYNEKGQRTKVEFGNAVTASYTYDTKTFRLVHLHTERAAGNDPVLQEIGYTYDAVGNIAEIDDAAQPRVFNNNQQVQATSEYTYDPLYRLIEATGREKGQGGNYPGQPTEDDFAIVSGIPDDGTTLVNYREQYAYDAVGNLLDMRHRANNNDDVWRRGYAYAPDSNRLVATSLPGDDPTDPTTFHAAYTHDDAGNMTVMPHLPTMEWDYAGRLVHVTRTVGGNTDHTYFTYDAAGQRVRKVTIRNGAITKERLYIGGGYEVYRETVDGNDDAQLERESVHVMDDRKRIAMVDTKTIDGGQSVQNPTPIVRYQFDNHLGSATLELSDTADIISYEEYHPYGTSSYRADDGDVDVSPRRYRYTGKERDEETGLYYHGARYYVPWLGRWAAADPKGMIDGPSLYPYVRNNPLRYLDPVGTDSILPTWREFKESVHAAEAWAGQQSERAGAALVDFASKHGASPEVAALGGAIVETAGKVVAGALLTGPSAVVAVGEAPERIGEGAAQAYQGAQKGNWEHVLEGTGKVLEGLGDVASAGLLLESAAQAGRARTAISAATSSTVPAGTTLDLQGPKPATGASKGTAYHRILRDANTGESLSKTTTIVSREGVVARQHADYYARHVQPAPPGRAAGATSTRLPPGATRPTGEPRHFPSRWTGILDVPGRTAPSSSRSATLGLHGTAKTADPSVPR